jgi:DNA polymerase elongation subunit (family B)
MHFYTKWEEIQPTIVTGWNIDGFDMLYLYNRSKRVVGETNAKRISPIGIAHYNKYAERMMIAGVSSLDYLNLYKKFSGKTEPSYTLGAIGKKVVNIDKLTYRGSLNDLYKEDINRYIEYNLNDVKIVVALDQKLQFIDLARGICHTGHVSYEHFGTSSRYLEGAILIYLRRQGKVAPNKPIEGREEYEQQLEDNEEGFEGAYVKDPVPGRYDWVYDLDLTSMYPNIIISLNISPETKVGKAENWNAEEFVRGNLQTVNLSGQTYNAEDFRKMLEENNFSIASNGAIYKQPTETGKEGTIPSILIKWFNERKEMRKLAKKFADEKDWEKYEFYDQRQKIQKILLNSIYGCLGLPIWRFYDKDNAAAVTLSGQDIIKTAGKAINQYYKSILGNSDTDYIIYIDTDSVGPNSVVKIKGRGDFKIKDLFEELVNDECDYIEDIMGKKFIFPKNLQMPYYDEKDGNIKYGNVKYIEKHKVKKLTYRIKTKNGKSVDVTEDHSIMVIENSKVIEKKPKELNKNDKIISIL